ncbi:MAG TPA: type IV toxin-antitoxin system AbiEi family antitoxin domain-containing protein [Thermoleophilaceae bacterium]|nr:type IV toxin-antitoxin system AbiEi family antitoxin domain-containing protein [Thermoleophilaceae bacterium]
MAQLDRSADRIGARLAARQFGVVTRRQLLAAGVSPAEVRHRLGCGALIRVHRGVYRAGHNAPSTDASYLAAVYACGSGAILGGLAAAWRYGTVKGPAPPPEVIAPGEHHVTGVRARRGRLDPLDHAVWKGIPTLTVPATLVDLAARLGVAGLARACHEAGVRFGTTPRHVDAVLGRRPNAKGAANLGLVMTGDERVALSRLESSFQPPRGRETWSTAAGPTRA